MSACLGEVVGRSALSSTRLKRYATHQHRLGEQLLLDPVCSN